jgi:hypothetical protein
MYRGSAKIRDYSYTVLEPVVSVVRRPRAQALRGISLGNAASNLQAIFTLLGDIDAALKMHMPDISVTDTLKTKIALGTLACIPAYDRFVCTAVRDLGWPAAVSTKSFSDLLGRAAKHAGFATFCARVRSKRIMLPELRLLDAYLNYMGSELLA